MRLDEKIALMDALPLLGLLEPQARHVLAFSAEERSLRAGDVLFERGARADGGFLVLSGRIALNAAGAGIEGAQMIGPGLLIGEAALIAETTRPGTALAVEPTRLLVLPRSLMHKVLEAHPDSAAALRRHMAAKVAATEFELRTMLD